MARAVMRTLNPQNRKTNPRVIDGVVQKKHNHTPTSTYWNTPQAVPVIDKERPGPGYRHYLGKRDVLHFIELLPDWPELSKGLDAVLLARRRRGAEAWYDVGVVGICAWDEDPWSVVRPSYYDDHKLIFARLGVPCEPKGKNYLCKFSEGTVRAYQLLHLFLHELGHHHDRMTSRRQRASGRGETYAEQYALRYEELIWARYFDEIGFD